jgi:hypothetical protein
MDRKKEPKQRDREREPETNAPRHGEPRVEEEMERIAETNLPRENEANEINREDSRPGTNT